MNTVSIIIPVFNGAPFLESTVRRLQSQSYQDIEIVIVDDGSVDESFAICRKVAKKDNRIKVVHQDNAGICQARNAGLKSASGRYVMFCDQDDVMLPDAVSSLVARIEETGSDLIIGSKVLELVSCGLEKPRTASSHVLQYQDETLVSKEQIIELAYNEDGMHRASHLWNCLYVRAVIEENNIAFDPAFKKGFEDTDFNFFYLSRCASVSFSRAIVYCYRRRISESTSLLFNEAYLSDVAYLLTKMKAICLAYSRPEQGGAERFGLFALRMLFSGYDHEASHGSSLRRLCDVVDEMKGFYTELVPRKLMHGRAQPDVVTRLYYLLDRSLRLKNPVPAYALSRMLSLMKKAKTAISR